MLPSLSGKISNQESVTIAGISEDSALGRGICARFIIADLDELRIVLSISNRNPDQRRLRVFLKTLIGMIARHPPPSL
jgi:hypothetical protein